MDNIHYYDFKIRSGLIKRNELKKYLKTVFYEEKVKLDTVKIIFCTDQYLLSLNKKFLNHNFYTDTLTFLFSKNKEPISGEIYISVDRVKANAKTFNISFQNEVVRVIIHSCLHLIGFTDTQKSSKLKMIRKQEFYLKEWLVSRET